MQLKYKSQQINSSAATLGELRKELAEKFDLANSSIRLLGAGKRVDTSASDDALLAEILNIDKPVMVLATPAKSIAELQTADQEHERQVNRRLAADTTLAKRARAPRTGPQTQLEYTFGEIKALPYGDSEAALRYLHRIRDDKAVQALMAKYRLKVGLLTELDPASNTRHDGRTLGLNENAGQVIYLRIRTDAYDGFCNYNEILLTLCHELAHNTHSDHSKQFWETCRLYEKQIKELNPWKGGHSLQ